MKRLPLSLLLLLPACGAGPPVVALDPVEIRAEKGPDGKTRTWVRDWDELLGLASDHFDAKRWAEAAFYYGLLLREFPTQPGLGAVAFNAGLSSLRAGQAEEAAARFRQAIARASGTRDARDAVFLLAEALSQAGRHAEAAQVYLGALDDPEVAQVMGGPLGLLDRIEATTLAGIALRRAGDLPAAERQLIAVERLYADNRDIRLVAESEWVARAWFERGDIYRELFESIRFRLPVERMQVDLEDKANLFLKAQAALFRCVRLHNPKWSVAAGFLIGNLYSRLIDDIYEAEVPPGLDASTVAAYREELWQHTGKLANRAAVVYRKNIELAALLGQDDAWVAKSRQALERVERLLESESRQRVDWSRPREEQVSPGEAGQTPGGSVAKPANP